jgi:hypothetical protein
MVGGALEAEGAEGDLLEALPPEGAFRLEDVLHGAVDVLGDVEVEPAVAVGVEEGPRPCSIRAIRPPTRAGDVLEAALARGLR